MQIALHDLGLEHLWIVYPGRQEYSLAERLTVVPAEALPRLAAALAP